MFSENWVWLILVLVVLSAVLGHSGLLLIAVAVMTVAPLAWLWNRFVLRRVEYTRTFENERAFAGERVGVTVAVTNRKPLPVPWLRIDDAFPDDLPVIGRELKPSSIPKRAYLSHAVTLGPYERVRWRYEIDCVKRGFYFFGPVELHSGDIFGFFSQQQRLDAPGRLIVYPQVRPLPELGFPGKNPFGEQKATLRIFEDPSRTIGVREYHPEDSMRRVHWKATARHGELQVRVYEPTVTQVLAVFLNVATFPQPWLGVIPERQEHAISVAASIAYHATERRFAVGLIANGSVPQSDQPIRVLPGRAPDQLMRILEALAAVTGFATSTIEQLLAAESPSLPWGATLVVVTAVVTEELLAEMARLRDAGRRLVLVSIDPQFTGEGPEGIVTYHLPAAEVDFSGTWTEVEPAAEPRIRPQGYASEDGGTRGNAESNL